MYLFEELVLLAINPYNGQLQIAPSIRAFRVCIAGAILRDLELLQRIKISKKGITMISSDPIQNILLGNVLYYLKQVGQFKSVEHNLFWIAHHIPDVEVYITDLLVEQKILNWNSRGRYNVIIDNRVEWYRLDWYVKAWIEKQIPIDMYGLGLLGVARWCGVLKRHLNPQQRPASRIYLDYLIRSDFLAKIIHKLVVQKKAIHAIVL